MTKKEQSVVADTIKSAIMHGIESVLGNQSKTFEIAPFKKDTLTVPPAIVKDIMTALGWKPRITEDNPNGFDTNGWQYDWWMHFCKKGDARHFTAHGSGYYGGFSFHPTEEP